MKPKRRRRIYWPFIALMIGLFVLSLTAPHWWWRRGNPPRQDARGTTADFPRVDSSREILTFSEDDPKTALDNVSERQRSISAEVLPADHSRALSTVDVEIQSQPIEVPKSISAPSIPDNLEQDITSTGSAVVPTPVVELPSPPIAEQWRPGDAPTVALLPSPIDSTPASTLPPRGAHTTEVDRAKQLSPDQIKADDPFAARIPMTLLEQLARVAECAECREWANRIIADLHALVARPTASDAEALRILAELKSLSAEGTRIVGQTHNTDAAARAARAQYALARRLDVWDKVYRGVLPSTAEALVRVSDHQRLSASLAQLDKSTLPTVEGRSLNEYLALGNIRDALERDASESNMRERRLMALRTLARLERLNPTAKRWPTRDHSALVALSEELRGLVAEVVTADQVLTQMERYERSQLDRDGRELALLARRLVFSPDTAQQAVGQQIETHYRNSNLRIAVSDAMLNRYVSAPRTQSAPVNDTILGVPVTGCSKTTNQVTVRMLPDGNYLRLCMETRGVVNSQTVSSSGPATFHNLGESFFTAEKMIRIGTDGLRVSHATADANTNNELSNIETNFDTLPLVGSIVRNIAESQFYRNQPDAESEAEEKVRARVKSQLDKDADAKLAEAENDFSVRVWKRLQKLELDPQVSGLSTTEQRMIARLRLAGDEQLAAHTPRPQAPADSWASLQIHQSAINNALRNMKFEGRTFTPAELCVYLAGRLDAPKLAKRKDELTSEATITFADHEPVKIDCREGRMTLTIAIADLAHESNHFRDFTARIHYKGDPIDLKSGLVRDGVVELLGDNLNMRTQVALRGVMAKLFPKEKRLSLLPDAWLSDPRVKDLTVTQFVAEDGWIGWAIGPAARTATLSRPNLR